MKKQFLQGLIWTNDVTCSSVNTWAQLTSASFATSPACTGSKIALRILYRTTLIQRLKGAVILFQSKQNWKESSSVLPCCAFQKQILFFGNALCTRLGQIFLYVCIYVDVCTYVSNVRDVFIASMLLAMCHFTVLPEPQALLQPRPAGFLPPTPMCKAVLARQASLECGNKTKQSVRLGSFSPGV